MADRPKIIIVGGGFAGVRALLESSRLFKKDEVEITLISNTNYFLFTPLLHEVATGALFPENVVTPLRPMIKKAGADFIQAGVKSVDLNKQQVLTTAGHYNYDYLILAPGSTTNFYDTPGAADNCFTLKDVNDAIRLKNRFIRAFEMAAQLPVEDRAAELTFVVVGGGPTGVGLAAEMTDFLCDSFKNVYPDELVNLVKIILVERSGEILPQFSNALRELCLHKVVEKGVTMKLNQGVVAVTNSNLTLSGGEVIATKTVIWTAGVKPQEVSFKPLLAMEKGRVVVESTLNLAEYNNVYVVGDAAAVKNNQEGILPMLAQVAHKAAPVVVKNIKRTLLGEAPRAFHYHHRGTLISLGSWWAAAEIGPFRFSGRFAWWLWRMVYLTKMPTLSKKFQIALDWTIDLFTARDVSMLPCSGEGVKRRVSKT